MINLDEIKTILQKINIPDIKSQLEASNKKLESVTDFNSPEYIEIIREINAKNGLINIIETLEQNIKEYSENLILAEDENFKDLANEEINRLTIDIEILSIKIKDLTKRPLPNDEKKAIFEIRPGVGGAEAGIFAEDLYKMYIKYCNENNIKVELFSLDQSDEGIKEVIFLVDANDTFGKLRFESGIHRVQRVPKTETLGRIHTSTASVAVLPQFEAKDININQSDIRIDVYRSSGPGGQSVNTTDSAVRITHLPTKIIVTCQTSKSQHKNKEMAMSVLMSKLQQIEEEKYTSAENKIRQDAIKDSERSSKIRTYNFPQSRVTDHRINKSWFNIEEIMNGELEDVLISTSTGMREG